VELDRVKNVAKAREQAVEKLSSELEATKEQARNPTSANS